jgi:hypothetical protein
MPRPDRIVRWLAILVLVVVPVGGAALLLTTDGWSVNRLNVRIWYAVTAPLGLHTRITPDDFAVIANVLLFVPVFWALAVLWPRWWWIVVGAGVSIAVELYHSGLDARLAEVSDVLANTTGTALGVIAGMLTRRALDRAAAARPARPLEFVTEAAAADPLER